MLSNFDIRESIRISLKMYELTSRSSVAQYLKLHPEMSRELMVPSGFPQRPLRRYERYLGSDQPLCAQNGYVLLLYSDPYDKWNLALGI